MPCPDRNSPFVVLPEFGTSVPIATAVFGPSSCAGARIQRLPVAAGARALPAQPAR